MARVFGVFIVALLGVLLGAGGVWFYVKDNSGGAGAEARPLYWVAPMDPNFRRDSPGKSPMGMDLIPVYEESAGGAEPAAGEVYVSPAVINNLGVRTAKVVSKPLETNIQTTGYVQYNEDRLVHIHPRVEGWIEKLYVKSAGAPVKNGQALYSLYSPELVNAQEEFLLALNSGNNRLIQSARAKLRSLNISDAFINNLSKQRQSSQTVTFYAPQTGVVDNLNIREGFFVQPGTTLMSIGSLDTVWVEAEVFERQAQLVTTGLPVTMTLGYLQGESWQGEVDYVYPALDPRIRTLRVRLRFENSDHRLKPNMFASVTMHLTSDEPVIAVPKEAVIHTGHNQRVVLSLGGGRFKSVLVQTGREGQADIEVIQGVKPGETVVVSAQFLLDSESAKTAEFSRIEQQQNALPSATVQGRVNAIDAEQRTLNISREAIEKWSRPPATMDFQVANNIDLTGLDAGDSVHFTFVIDQGEFIVTELHIMDEPAAMDHSAHFGSGAQHD